MNLADAAEQVLREASNEALHAKEIAKRAMKEGLISPHSETPWVYVAAAIRKDNRRRQRNGQPLRFELAGGGCFHLTR